MLKFAWVRYALVVLVVLLALFAGWIIWSLAGLPTIDPQNWAVQSPSVRITDRSGRLLYESLTGEGGRNLVVPLSEISTSLLDATVATEDQTFFRNPGVEPVGILRAVWINLQGGETLSGGSTITQQVARTLLMSQAERNEQSFRRKLREAVLAWQLTRRFSKQEILAIYLNQTYYGGMNYGVEAAAQTYFAKSASELSLAEAALLAGIPQTPALYNPFTYPDAAVERRNVVLGLMQKQGMITPQEFDTASQEPLFLASTPFPMEAPHFVMMVRAQIDAFFTQDQIRDSGGLVVQTSLDLNWQHIAEEAVAYQLETVAATDGQIQHNMNNASVVVLDPSSGQIRVMVGSPDFFDNRHQGAINMALAPRQPGSALKPFIYALALDPEQTEPWTAATMILDVSTNFLTQEGRSYIPSNYDQQEHGPVLVRQALSSSLNIPAVSTLNQVGLDRLVNFFHSIGADASGLRDRDISLALGGGELSLLDLTRAYGVLANGGCGAKPVAILSIQGGDGEQLYKGSQPGLNCVMDLRVAWLVSDILSDDSARLLGFPANSVLNIGRPAAVKTGTTTNFHDNWTVGYTPDVVVGVWVGNASNQAMQDVTGLSGAGPIWHAVIRNILTGTSESDFVRPEGLNQVEICSLSGMLPNGICPYTRMEWFIDGTEPQDQDTVYMDIPMDATSGQNNSDELQRTDRLVLNLPISAQNWAHEHGLTLYSDINGIQPAVSSGQSAADQIMIQSPVTGSLYVASSKVPAQDQQIQVRVVTSLPEGNLELLWNGKLFASTSERTLVTWLPLQVGKHTLLARVHGADGEIISSEPVLFEVDAE